MLNSNIKKLHFLFTFQDLFKKIAKKLKPNFQNLILEFEIKFKKMKIKYKRTLILS